MIFLTGTSWAQSDLAELSPTPAPQQTQPAEIETFALDGLSGARLKSLLSLGLGDGRTLAVRGPHDAALYRNTSPAVVMVVTSDSIGSGAYLGNGIIVSNWHVVQRYQAVGIIPKPEIEGATPTAASLLRGQVVRTDPSKDLALIQVAAMPSQIKPLQMGSSQDIQIGADVHAIGHPTGEACDHISFFVSTLINHSAERVAHGQMKPRQ